MVEEFPYLLEMNSHTSSFVPTRLWLMILYQHHHFGIVNAHYCAAWEI